MQLIVLWWEAGEWTGHKHWPYSTQGSCKGEALLPLIEELHFSLLSLSAFPFCLSIALYPSLTLLPFLLPLPWFPPFFSLTPTSPSLTVFLTVSLLTVTARVSGLQTRAPCLFFPHSLTPPSLPFSRSPSLCSPGCYYERHFILCSSPHGASGLRYGDDRDRKPARVLARRRGSVG